MSHILLYASNNYLSLIKNDIHLVLSDYLKCPFICGSNKVFFSIWKLVRYQYFNNIHLIYINQILRRFVKCTLFNLSIIKIQNHLTQRFILYKKQKSFLLVIKDGLQSHSFQDDGNFLDILLVFIYPLTYFYINFFHTLFLYHFLHQIIGY